MYTVRLSDTFTEVKVSKFYLKQQYYQISDSSKRNYSQNNKCL